VTDHIAGKEVAIQYCPTGEMVPDFFTKPLQGALFRKLCSIIMNNDPHGGDHGDHRSVLEDNNTERSTEGVQGNLATPRQVLKDCVNNSNVVGSKTANHPNNIARKIPHN
jgi:hypothetical protein